MVAVLIKDAVSRETESIPPTANQMAPLASPAKTETSTYYTATERFVDSP